MMQVLLSFLVALSARHRNLSDVSSVGIDAHLFPLVSSADLLSQPHTLVNLYPG